MMYSYFYELQPTGSQRRTYALNKSLFVSLYEFTWLGCLSEFVCPGQAPVTLAYTQQCRPV